MGSRAGLLGHPYPESGPGPITGDILARVAAGETITLADAHHPVLRDGKTEDAWFTITISPIRDEDGQVAGALAVLIETTADRRTALALRESEARFRALLRAEGDDRREITAEHRAAEALRATEGRYRALFDAIDQGFCIIEMIFDAAGKPVDYVFLEANPAFVAHTGLPDPVGKRMREMIPDHEQYWFDIYGRIALTGKAERFEQHTAGLGRWLDLYAFRIGAPDAHRVAVLFNDISDRRRAEAALRDSEERLRHIIESATEYAIITLSAAGGIESWNSGAERLLGYDEAEVLGQSFAVLHTNEDAAAGEPERKLKLASREGRAESRHWVVCKDGSRFWGSGVILPMERDGNRFIKIFRDRTEERAAEERQAMLTGELNHRVKNTLSVVQAIASQTFRGSGVEDGVLDDFSGRLQALAAGHDLLVRKGWHGADLLEVACKVLAPFRGTEGRVQIAGPEIPLSPSSALSIAMVFHELATNAVKYGALANRTGKVEASWTASGPAGGEELHFRWEEIGGPAVEQPGREGFGSMLIAHSLSREIGAETCLDYAPTGLICTITARVSDLTA